MSDLSRVIRDVTAMFEALDISAVFTETGVGASMPPLSFANFTAVLERTRLPDIYEEITKRGYSVHPLLRRHWFTNSEGSCVQFGCEGEKGNIVVGLSLAESAGQRELIERRQLQLYEGFRVWRLDSNDEILLRLTEYRCVGHDVRKLNGQDLTYVRQWAQDLGVLDRLELAIRDNSAPDY